MQHFESDDRFDVLNVMVRCRYADGEARPLADDEVAAVYWLSPAALESREDVAPFLGEYVDAVEAAG